MKKQQRKQKKRAKRRNPENEHTQEEHPMREDDWGAWSDHDQDYVLQGRMP